MTLNCRSRITQVHPRAKDRSRPYSDRPELGGEVCGGELSVIVASREEQYFFMSEDTRALLEIQVSCSRCRSASHEAVDALSQQLREDDQKLDLTKYLQ